MCQYNHLTLIEREKLLQFLAEGFNLTRIAQKLRRNKSTISREIRRNADTSEYIPKMAQDHYEERRKNCRRHKILADPEIFSIVSSKFIDHSWSPEQIANRLNMERHKKIISYATIYRGIYSGMFDSQKKPWKILGAAKFLRHHGRKRRRKQIQDRRGRFFIERDISERSAGAVNRSRRGHWEIDTVGGLLKKPCLVTCVDRKTRFLKAGKAVMKAAKYVTPVIEACLKAEPLHSVTPDRGREFSRYRTVEEDLDVKFYFPPAHQPWQRGTNENTNGLLREYFPKRKDIGENSDERIQEVVDEINMRPRKCLGYKTPYEVYYSKTLHLI